ncbi:MAG TPA: Ig-like domain-containing protein [Deinococcales bacterium]|nr:Ig-like domain-containing protein [Deinococcales bacterium]
MKRLAFLVPVLAVVLTACPSVKGPSGTNPPDAAFSGFTNATSQVALSARGGVVPQNFLASIRASSDNQVTKTQCFLDGALVGGDSTTFQRSCAYLGVPAGPHDLRVEATDQYGNVAGTTLNVDVVPGTPSFSTGLVGSTNLNFAQSGTLVSVPTGSSPSLSFQAVPGVGGAAIVTSYVKVNNTTVKTGASGDVTTVLDPVNASENVTLGVVDSVGNRAEYRFMLNPQDTSAGDQSAPIVIVSSPGSGATVSGKINVTVEAGHPNGIKDVTLLIDGAQEKGQVTDSAPYTFTVDTTAKTNGPHTFSARAESTNGVSATSTPVNVTIQNVQPPVLSITDPLNGTTIQGVQAVQLSVAKRASDFTFVGGTILVQISDYRGTVVASQTVSAADNVDGTYSTAPFDLSSFPNDSYTITASATVNVPILGAQALTSVVAVSTKNASLVPPAVIITNPVRVTPDQSTLPIFGDAGFGYVFSDVSDNTGVSHVELRLTCDTCGAGGPVDALEGYVAYPTPATAASPILRFDMDGTPYLPDGNYTARVVAQDQEGNRNVQEIKIKLDRAQHTAGLYPVALVAGPDNVGAKLSPGSASYTINGLNNLDRYRAGEVVLDPKGNAALGQSIFGGQASETFAEAFNVDGAWLFFAQVEDLNPARPLVVPTSRLVQVVNKIQ